MNSLAARLKAARELRSLTQAQLAGRAGCEQSAIGNVESGARKTMRNLIEVARALEVSVDWLYDGQGPSPFTNGKVAEPIRSYLPPTSPAWPFDHVSPERWLQLPDLERGRIQGYVERIVLDFEHANGRKSQRA